MCFLSNQAHRLCCGAYFQVRVLANIDHTLVSIASLFAAIKNYIFKIKVIRVKSIFINLNWLHNWKKKTPSLEIMFHFSEDEKGRERGGGGGGRHLSLYFYVKLNFSLFYQIPVYFYLLKERLKNRKILLWIHIVQHIIKEYSKTKENWKGVGLIKCKYL